MNQRDYDDPIDALKAELASVSLSPQFQSRVRQRIAGELDLLRDELAAVAPSPEFAARVRQGIDADAAVRGANWLTGWRWLVPAGAVVAVAIAVIAISRPRPEAPVQVIAQAPAETSNPPATTQEPLVPSPAPARVSRASSANSKLRSSNSGSAEPSTALLRTGEAPFPEVITNQAAVLRELWARVDRTAALVEKNATTLPDTIPEIVINPIEVSPIVIRWLGDPQTAPGAPIIRRITADMAERSEK